MPRSFHPGPVTGMSRFVAELRGLLHRTGFKSPSIKRRLNRIRPKAEQLEDRSLLAATTAWDVSLVQELHQGQALFAGESFGNSVDMNSVFTVIGSARADVNGVSQAGRVSVFDTVSGNLLRTIENPTPGVTDEFGTVALSGHLLIVSTPNDNTQGTSAGAAYVYDLRTGSLEHTLFSPTPSASNQFGFRIDIADDVIAVSEPGNDEQETDHGAVHLFDSNSGAFLRTIFSANPGANFHFSESLLLQEDVVIKGARGMDLLLEDANIDIKTGTMESSNPVQVKSENANISADSVRVEDNGNRILFNNRVKMTIVRPVERGVTPNSN